MSRKSKQIYIGAALGAVGLYAAGRLNLIRVGNLPTIGNLPNVSVSNTPTVGLGVGGSGGVSQAAINQWAANIGVPACVGSLFVQQFGRLPGNVPELDSWGDGAGYHHPDGSWTCG